MVLLADTREQENDHILDYFDNKGIDVVEKGLKTGDYSFGVKLEDGKKSFENEIVVERKGSGNCGLTELSGNLFQKRELFEQELTRSQDMNFFLLIENADWYRLLNGMYDTDADVESYLGTIQTFRHRYDMSIDFIDKRYSGKWLYSLFKYYIREREWLDE